MSNQIYIPPINFNEFDNQTGSITSINAIEPLEYNKINSQLSIKAATENNYGVITTGDQNIKGNKNFVDGLSISTGTITTTPTKDTDISNKKYVDNKTTDLVKYNTSTKYLIDNKTNSNINTFRVNNLSVDNQINGSSASVSVSTKGYHGTDTKNITVFKGYVNGMTCIIFNKNTEINSYKWVSDIPIDNNGMTMNFSNFSDIFSSLPQMFELTGETSTYGGSKNIATKTLKFVKSSSGYSYIVQYDKSFQMNLFKLKDSIKDTDTYIFTSEANKIGTLTIDKGYLYNSPTENNNLVNKSYVDTKDNEITSSLNSNVSTLNENIENAKSELSGNIESVKSELNENIENAKSELNGNISTAISQINTVSLSTGTLENVQNNNNSLTNKNYVDNQISKAKVELNNSINSAKSELNQNITTAINNIKIDNVDLTTGTISTDPTNETDITNKKYIDNAKAELNAKIISTINGIKNIDLTTGTISATPTNNTDISNKKYVDDSLESLKSFSESNFIKYDSGSSKLIKSSSTTSQEINNLSLSNLTSENSTFTNSTIDNLTSTTSTINNLTINDSLLVSQDIADVKLSTCSILNSELTYLIQCSLSLLKLHINNMNVNNSFYLILDISFNTKLRIDGKTLYIKNAPLCNELVGSVFDVLYFGLKYVGTNYTQEFYFFNYCTFTIKKESDGTYTIEITGTNNGLNDAGVGYIYGFNIKPRIINIQS